MKPVSQIRRENLAALVERHGQAAVAAAIERDRNQIYQWLLEPEAAGARNLSGSSSRALEKAYRLPSGWLDHEHGDEPEPQSQSAIPDPGILMDAELLVLAKEGVHGRYVLSERARQLAQAYGLVLTYGAVIDQAALTQFMDERLAADREQADEHSRRARRR